MLSCCPGSPRLSPSNPGSIGGLEACWSGWFGGDLSQEQSDVVALTGRQGSGQQHVSLPGVTWGVGGSTFLFFF